MYDPSRSHAVQVALEAAAQVVVVHVVLSAEEQLLPLLLLVGGGRVARAALLFAQWRHQVSDELVVARRQLHYFLELLVLNAHAARLNAPANNSLLSNVFLSTSIHVNTVQSTVYIEQLKYSILLH